MNVATQINFLSYMLLATIICFSVCFLLLLAKVLSLQKKIEDANIPRNDAVLGSNQSLNQTFEQWKKEHKL